MYNILQLVLQVQLNIFFPSYGKHYTLTITTIFKLRVVQTSCACTFTTSLHNLKQIIFIHIRLRLVFAPCCHVHYIFILQVSFHSPVYTLPLFSNPTGRIHCTNFRTGLSIKSYVHCLSYLAALLKSPIYLSWTVNYA